MDITFIEYRCLNKPKYFKHRTNIIHLYSYVFLDVDDLDSSEMKLDFTLLARVDNPVIAGQGEVIT